MLATEMPITKLPLDTVRLLGSALAISTSPSLVKELLENALDAAATSVEVLISADTIDKIQVRDNGTGIPLEDIRNLGRRAHTSKLRRIEDLDGEAKTLGFRGEALASTLSLAQGGVGITTRTAGETVATKFSLKKGTGGAENRKPGLGPVGTTVTVEGLFGSLPVRRKQAEIESRKSLAKIRDLMLAYVLARPYLKLSLKVMGDTNQVWRFSPAGKETVRDVVVQILGKSLASQCIYVEKFWTPEPHGPVDAPTISMQAFLPVSNCNIEAIKGKGAFISVDQRPITSIRGAGKKIAVFYKRCLGTTLRNSIPSPFMQLSIRFSSGAGYDPNIEPLKDEVLFVDEERVLNCFAELCRSIYSDGEHPAMAEERKDLEDTASVLRADDRPSSDLSQAILRGTSGGSAYDLGVGARAIPTAAVPEPKDYPGQETACEHREEPQKGINSNTAFRHVPGADADMSQSVAADISSTPSEEIASAIHKAAFTEPEGSRVVEKRLLLLCQAFESLDEQPEIEPNEDGNVTAEMRTRARVNLSRMSSDATDKESYVDTIVVQVPAQTIQGTACDAGMSRAVPNLKPTPAAHQLEDITRYLQPRNRIESFQIATNGTATGESAPVTVEKSGQGGVKRTPLHPVRDAVLNESQEGDDGSLFGDRSEPGIIRPRHPSQDTLDTSSIRNDHGSRELNMDVPQQTLSRFLSPLNSTRALTQTTLSLGSYSWVLPTPPPSGPSHRTRQRPARLSLGLRPNSGPSMTANSTEIQVPRPSLPWPYLHGQSRDIQSPTPYDLVPCQALSEEGFEDMHGAEEEEEDDRNHHKGHHAGEEAGTSRNRLMQADEEDLVSSVGQWSHFGQAMLMRTPRSRQNPETFDVDVNERDFEIGQGAMNLDQMQNREVASSIRPVSRPYSRREGEDGLGGPGSAQNKKPRVGRRSQLEDASIERPYAAACDVGDSSPMETDQSALCAGALPAPSVDEGTEASRQSLRRRKRSKTPGGRSRRLSSASLPLEKTPYRQETYSLCTILQTAEEKISQLMDWQAAMGVDTTHGFNLTLNVKDGTLYFQPWCDVTDVESRVKKIVKGQYFRQDNLEAADLKFTIRDQVNRRTPTYGFQGDAGTPRSE